MDSNQVLSDFLTDYATECLRQLRAAGYSVATPIDHEATILSYLNVRRRRVPIRPRKIHKAHYSVPTHLVNGELQFLAKVASGGDLRPYQSTKIEKPTFNDGMLDDFGIQHFHLGITKHPKNPSFVARQDPLLFALVHDDDFFCIGYFSHGNWSKKTLLDIVHSNWPDAISVYSIRGAQLTVQYTDKEHEHLRNAGINVFTTRPDGIIHTGPGGGITLAGTSIKDTLDLNRINRLCYALKSAAHRAVDQIVSSAKLTLPVYLKLRFRHDVAYIDIDGKCEIKITPTITVPPL